MIFETTQSDLAHYNGMKIIASAPLDESRYDKEDVGEMLRIKLEDGTLLDAFEDEMLEEKYDRP